LLKLLVVGIVDPAVADARVAAGPGAVLVKAGMVFSNAFKNVGVP